MVCNSVIFGIYLILSYIKYKCMANIANTDMILIKF